MKRILFAVCAVAAMAAMANPANAQTIDIVDYMDVTPGQWSVKHVEENCSGYSWDHASVISAYGSYTLMKHYEIVNGNLILGDATVLQITENSLIWLGNYDYGTRMRSVLSPPIIIPRSLSLNESVFNAGTITTGSETESYSRIFMITETGLSVTTPAGTFNNCIKVKWAEIEGNNSGVSTEICAPGMGEVQGYAAFIEEDGGLVDVETKFYEVTSYGGP